jgi:agmatinase
MEESSTDKDIELCKIGVVGFCYDDNSSFMAGTASAPPLIKAALFSGASNLWSESGKDLGQPNILFDAGDFLPSGDTSMMTAIEAAITRLLLRGLRPLSLGGDHSISYPIIRALSKQHETLSVLHIDAHPDLYDDFWGNRYSHASPFARIMEESLITRLIQVGIRTMNGHQRAQAERFGVEVHEMKDFHDALALRFDTPVYVSVDLDGLDPAFAPGVSHREPGGLSMRQLINLIHRLEQPVVGADIVEFNPKRDVEGVTATVCAKLVKELAAKMLWT